MGVAHNVGEASRNQLTDMREHVSQQRITRNVEGHAETHVARSLVELAVQVALGLRLVTVLRIPLLAWV